MHVTCEASSLNPDILGRYEKKNKNLPQLGMLLQSCLSAGILLCAMTQISTASSMNQSTSSVCHHLLSQSHHTATIMKTDIYLSAIASSTQDSKTSFFYQSLTPTSSAKRHTGRPTSRCTPNASSSCAHQKTSRASSRCSRRLTILSLSAAVVTLNGRAPTISPKA
jgi:hypothetical protein